MLAEALHWGAVTPFLYDVLLSQNVTRPQNHDPDVLGLVHLLTLEAVDCVDESRILQIVQILLILHMRKELHHVEWLGVHRRILDFLLHFKVSVNYQANFLARLPFFVNKLIPLEWFFREVVAELSKWVLSPPREEWDRLKELDIGIEDVLESFLQNLVIRVLVKSSNQAVFLADDCCRSWLVLEQRKFTEWAAFVKYTNFSVDIILIGSMTIVSCDCLKIENLRLAIWVSLLGIVQVS